MFLFYKPTTQYENLGDALIAKNLLELLSEKGKVLLLTQDIPKGFVDIIKNDNCVEISKIKFALLPVFYRMRNKEVAFVYKPGHLFGGDKEYGSGLKAFLKIFYVNALHFMGVKIIKTGVSVGPLSGTFLKAEKNISSKSYVYGVREDYSLQFVENNSFKKYKRVSDLAYYSILKNRDMYLNEKRDTISYSFRPYKKSNLSNELQAEKIAAAIIEVASKNDIGIVNNVTQVQTDLVFNNLIEKELVANGLIVRKYYYDITKNSFESIGDIYKNTRVILSNRLHSLLYAFEYGAYPIAIGEKVENFKVFHVLNDLKMEHIIVNIENDDINQYELEQAINSQLLNSNEWKGNDAMCSFI
ncbi:TPA: polysaccharide pyruvyl transferase family protein [Klebsiella variicola subsp. variicola]|nr:polysaccharide pyruvyl transferase family protein [Klebsiella variicola subsp. variicola]